MGTNRKKGFQLSLIFLYAIVAQAVPPNLSGESQANSRSFSASPSQTPTPSGDQLARWSLNNSYSPSAATNLHGISFPSLTASQAIGTRGQVLLQDFFLLDKLGSFNRQRIPERVVHAKGAGAHGYFTVSHDISRYTKAKFLNGIGKRTPVFVRFSTAVGEKGSADTVVDHKGFAIKFYTEDGNYDWLGISTEIFIMRDAMLFPDVNMSRKKNPQTNLVDLNMWWDLVSLRPETTLQALHLFSDIGKPNGYRRMDGHAVHAFNFVNASNKVVFAKMHMVADDPAPPLTRQESLDLTGTNPDYTTQDLYDAIAKKNYPSWTFYIQVMSLQQAQKHPINPFDVTRSWRREEYPWIPVGKLVLNRNPDNFFAEVEQAAFVPSNLVPGIEPSPDRVFAARLFAYMDTQRYRLGTNFAQLPINAPIAPVNTYIRDGAACYGENGGGAPNYHPNSFGGAVVDAETAAQVAFSVEGIVDRTDIRVQDEFEEARWFLERDIDPAQRQRLIEDMADYMKTVRREIRERVFRNNFDPISKEFGNQMRRAVDNAIRQSSGASTEPSGSFQKSGGNFGKWRSDSGNCRCPMGH